MVRTATLLAGSRASGEDLLQEALFRSYLSLVEGARCRSG